MLYIKINYHHLIALFAKEKIQSSDLRDQRDPQEERLKNSLSEHVEYMLLNGAKTWRLRIQFINRLEAIENWKCG